MPHATPTTSAQDHTTPGIIFYDGECGLCHGFVRFVLKRDNAKNAFQFSPIGSRIFRDRIPERDRTSLPDSVVVNTASGEMLSRSAAVFYVLRHLGGFWGLLARLAAVIPRKFSDWVYDLIASGRKKLFHKPDNTCPLVPPELRKRFLLDKPD